VRDSKKLSAARREALAVAIREQAAHWALGMASVEEIDTLNILNASLLAMRRAVARLDTLPDILRVDGNRSPFAPGEYSGKLELLIGGDDICPAIGAASILAKVARDALMDDLHTAFPEYGFDRHRGYPTVAHREALRAHGASPAHRRSFRPVSEVLAADSVAGRGGLR
jgi:ribonuclease HII